MDIVIVGGHDRLQPRVHAMGPWVVRAMGWVLLAGCLPQRRLATSLAEGIHDTSLQ